MLLSVIMLAFAAFRSEKIGSNMECPQVEIRASNTNAAGTCQSRGAQEVVSHGRVGVRQSDLCRVQNLASVHTCVIYCSLWVSQ